MVWQTISNGWIFVDDAMPPEGEYVLAISGEDSPIGICRLKDGEWETYPDRKRPIFTKTEMFWTSASVVYWMPLPKQPERLKRVDTER